MYRGIGRLRPPLSDLQTDVPRSLCGHCGGELYSGETVFAWEGNQLCTDCFKEGVAAWLEERPEEAAQELGVDYRSV